MISVEDEKSILFKKWFLEHMGSNTAPLFFSKAPDFQLTIAAENLLKSHLKGNYLYIMYFKEAGYSFIPLYVGKTTNLLNRWKGGGGHLQKLKMAANNNLKGTYLDWANLIEELDEEIFLFCLNEPNITFPPIPDFPITIGSIEYQLIALASAGYPRYLLNNEGVER